METTVGGNKYNFLGRETQTGTGYVDLMARFYDPKVPHFLTQDPVIEGQEDQSLYQYGWNNPILRSDPDGLMPSCCGGPILPSIMLQGFGDILKFTDANDVAVLITTATRNGNAINIGGAPATNSDKTMAAIGLFVPFVSGSLVKKVFDAAANVKANQLAGAAREVTENADLIKSNPGSKVQNQNYLRTADGKIAKDPVTGTGRKVDHAVIKDGKATAMVETTSQNASKKAQIGKENRIRESGGTNIRDRDTKKLIDVSNTPTTISRHN